MHLNFSVDRLEIYAREVVAKPKPAAIAPSKPQGPRTWRQTLGLYAQRLWPVAGAVGSALAFLIGRVGIGLRAEDVAWLLRLRPFTPE